MKIKEVLSKQGVSFSGPKEKNKTLCDNCGRPKLRHTSDQTTNCITALYLKA